MEWRNLLKVQRINKFPEGKDIDLQTEKSTINDKHPKTLMNFQNTRANEKLLKASSE